MNSVISKVLGLLQKGGYVALEYFMTTLQWVLKYARQQGKKCKRAAALKNMHKTYSGLGAAIYGLYKQGDADWSGHSTVQEELRQVAQAEASFMEAEAACDQIDNEFRSRKEEIHEKYAALRAQVGASEE